MSPFYKFARAVIYPFFVWLLPVRFIGFDEPNKEGGYILCANHTSNTDAFFLVARLKRQIHFMAKAELFRIPVVAQVLRAAGIFPVDRSKSDVGAVRRAEEIVKAGRVLGIFPEGTRYKTGAPRKAKAGIAYIAMHTKADILPISIYREGKFNIFKKTTIRCGKLISFEELVVDTDSDRENMRRITTRVMNEITGLWEMKHEH